jgi:NhaA family Na+:H+ antiporter
MMHVPPRSRGSALVQADTSFVAQRIILPSQRFFHTEITSGLMLLAAAIAAVVWANSPVADSYTRFWTTDLSVHFGVFSLSHTLREWINDALMAIFFFVVGLEIKREFAHGELSGWKRSSLPILCALGGMIVPAMLYVVFNAGKAGSSGWGIPMATDIAFSLGVLSLVGDRIPTSARIFLLAIATVDDVGAIVVIAMFYTDHVAIVPLIWAAILVAIIGVMGRVGIRAAATYIPIGVLFWFAVLRSGVHATIAGVALGLLTPTQPVRDKKLFVTLAGNLAHEIGDAIAAKDKDSAEALLGKMEQLTAETEAPSDRLVRILHPWSAYLVLPLFALANSGVTFNFAVLQTAVFNPITLGVAVGLFVGKCLGITGFAYLSTRLRVANLVPGLSWTHVAGLAMLGGIGFTISLFISDLAFNDNALVDMAKIGVFAASLFSGAAGFLLLRFASSSTAQKSSP